MHKGAHFIAPLLGWPCLHCRLSSYGPEQLAWLEAQLAEGLPTLVAAHFPLPTAAAEGGRGGLREVLSRHPNVRLLLSGHFHKVGRAWVGWGVARQGAS